MQLYSSATVRCLGNTGPQESSPNGMGLVLASFIHELEFHYFQSFKSSTENDQK